MHVQAEAAHNAVTHIHSRSDATRSISHDNAGSSGLPLISRQKSATESQADEMEAKKQDPNVWSVLNSIDDGSSIFGVPQERTSQEKKADSLQLVMDLIDKVNAQQSDFATADSKALRKVHEELHKVSLLVRNFLEYSTNLINDEGKKEMEKLPLSKKTVVVINLHTLS